MYSWTYRVLAETTAGVQAAESAQLQANTLADFVIDEVEISAAVSSISARLVNSSQDERASAFKELRALPFAHVPHPLVEQLFQTARVMFSQHPVPIFNPVTSNDRLDGPRFDCLEVLYSMYSTQFAWMIERDAFWRIIHFGLVQPDPFRIVRKYAVAMFRHALKCVQIKEAESGGDAATIAASEKRWELFLTIYEALEDFPVYLLLNVWNKMPELFSTWDSSDISNVIETLTMMSDGGIRICYDSLGNVHTEATCITLDDAAVVFPAALPRPSFTSAIPFEWTHVLLDRGFSHDNAATRRTLIMRTLLLGVPPEDKILRHFDFEDKSALPPASALGLCFPSWYTFSTAGFMRHIADATLYRGQVDVFGKSLQRFVFLYMRKHYENASSAAIAPAIHMLVRSLPLAMDAKGCISRIMLGWETLRSVRTSTETADLPLRSTGHTTVIQVKKCDLCCLRDGDLYALRNLAWKQSIRSTRMTTLERYLDIIQFALHWADPSSVTPAGLGFFFASFPARLVLPTLCVDRGDEALVKLNLYEHVSVFLSRLYTADQMKEVLHQGVQEYIQGRTSEWTAVSLARLMALYPWPAHDDCVSVLGPIIDELSVCYSHTSANKGHLGQAFRLLTALLVSLRPDSRNADLHLSYAIQVDGFACGSMRFLHDELAAHAFACGIEHFSPALPSEELYVNDSDINQHGSLVDDESGIPQVDDVGAATDATTAVFRQCALTATSVEKPHPALVAFRDIIGSVVSLPNVRAEVSAFLKLEANSSANNIIGGAAGITLLSWCANACIRGAEYYNTIDSILEEEMVRLEALGSVLVSSAEEAQGLVHILLRLALLSNHWHSTPSVDTVQRVQRVTVLVSAIALTKPAGVDSDSRFHTPSSDIRNAGSHPQPDGTSWSAFRGAFEVFRWQALHVLLCFLLRHGHVISDRKDATAVLRLPAADAEALASHLYEALDSADVSYMHLVLACAAIVMRGIASEGETSDAFGWAVTRLGMRTATPITSPTIDIFFTRIQALLMEPGYKSNRRVLFHALSCLIQPSYFLRPALAELQDGKASTLQKILAQLFTAALDEARPGWFMQLSSSRFLATIRVLLRLAKQAESTVPTDTALQAYLTRTVLSCSNVLVCTALHREPLVPGEDPALLDSAARVQIERWHRMASHDGVWQMAKEAVKDTLLPVNPAVSSAKLDQNADYEARTAPLRGSGFVTRVQVLMFFSELCRLSSAARTRAVVSASSFQSNACAIVLHRSLIFQFLSLHLQKLWQEENKPGSALEAIKLRCWQALAILCIGLGNFIPSDAPPVVETHDAVAFPSIPLFIFPPSTVSIPVCLTVTPETVPASSVAAVVSLPPGVIEKLFQDKSPRTSLDEAKALGLPVQKMKRAPNPKTGNKPPAKATELPIDLITDLIHAGASLALTQEMQFVPDQMVAAIICHVVGNHALSSLQLPPVRHYIEVTISSLARKFPQHVYETLCKPCVSEPNSKGQHSLTVALIVADFTAHLVRCLKKKSCVFLREDPVAHIHALLRGLFYDIFPLCAGTVGTLRGLTQTTMVSMAPTIFPVLFDGEGRLLPSLPDGAEALQLVHVTLRYILNNHELSAVMGKQQFHLGRIQPDVACSLESLLLQTPEEHGELIPADMFAEMKASFARLSSAMHLLDQHSWTSEECVSDEIRWAVTAGILPQRTFLDARLSSQFHDQLVPRAQPSPGEATGPADDTFFNFQRKVTSAVAQSAANATATAPFSTAASLPPFVASAVACSGEDSRTAISSLHAKKHPLLSNLAADGRRCQPIVVLASLLDKATNLGGLARTAEIFGAESLVVPDIRVKDDPMFADVSVSAGSWMTIHECPAPSTIDYIRAKRSQGYTIVGLEQAARSKRLGEVTFPEKVLLVLGAELQGMPPEIISELDICVEIPQLGIIRSLNVHVSASMLLWEYTRQRLAAAAAAAV